MLGISTVFHDNMNVFHLWGQNVRKHFPDALVSVAYSDEHYRAVIEAYGFIPVYSTCANLSNQANQSLLTLRSKVDKVLFLDTNQLVNDKLAAFYNSFHLDFAYFDDCYIFNIDTGKSKHRIDRIHGRETRPVKFGCIASVSTIDQITWTPFSTGSKQWMFNRRVMILQDQGKLDPIRKRLEDVNGVLVEIRNSKSIDIYNSVAFEDSDINLKDL